MAAAPGCFAAFNGTPAWIHRPIDGQRKIDLYEDRQFATFDESLESESFLCTARGAGTLIKREGFWHVVTRYLSFPTPNPLAAQTCKVVRKREVDKASDMAEKRAAELLRELELQIDEGLKDGDGEGKGAPKSRGKGKKKQGGRQLTLSASKLRSIV